MTVPAATSDVVVEPDDRVHWAEWGAEAAGTAILMAAVVSARTVCTLAGGWPASITGRVTIVGVVAGAAVVAVAFSRLGVRSGAHLNPAVTIGFWVQRTVGRSDVVGYVIAQAVGAVVGFAFGGVFGPVVAGPAIRWAQIGPAPGLPEGIGLVIETLGTAAMLAGVFGLMRSARTTGWAAPFAGAALAVLIVVFGPVDGAGFNPVRALAPDLLAGSAPALWTFLLGPVLGAVLAAVLVAALARRRPVTGKLRHDPTVPCHMRCELPHVVVPGGPR